jgi:hypothetical protein
MAKFLHLAVPQGRPRWRTWRHCRQTSPSRHVRHPGLLRVAPKSLKPIYFQHETKKIKNAFLATFVAKFRHLTAPEGRPRWRTWRHCSLGSLSHHVRHPGLLSALPKQRKPGGYQCTYHENNDGKNEPLVATFHIKFHNLAIFHMPKVKKKSWTPLKGAA